MGVHFIQLLEQLILPDWLFYFNYIQLNMLIDMFVFVRVIRLSRRFKVLLIQSGYLTMKRETRIHGVLEIEAQFRIRNYNRYRYSILCPGKEKANKHIHPETHLVAQTRLLFI